jgi:hypothetical protein
MMTTSCAAASMPQHMADVATSTWMAPEANSVRATAASCAPMVSCR